VSFRRRGHRDDWRELGEAEAYARCHGTRSEDVRIVKVEPKRPRYQTSVSGETLRAAFERRLDEREPPEAITKSPEPSGDGVLDSDSSVMPEQIEIPTTDS